MKIVMKLKFKIEKFAMKTKKFIRKTQFVTKLKTLPVQDLNKLNCDKSEKLKL